MKIKDFVNNYQLHDSSLVKVDYDQSSQKVTLIIDLCFYEQSDYVAGEPETGPVKVTFNKVSIFQWEDKEIYFETIFEHKLLKDGSVSFLLIKEDDGAGYELVVKAEDVSVEKLSDNYYQENDLDEPKFEFTS